MPTTKLIFPSLTNLAGTLGVPPHRLRKLKRMGAEGFLASNRVDVGKLLAWLLRNPEKARPDMSLEESRARLAQLQGERIEREMALAGGELLPAAHVFDAICAVLDDLIPVVDGQVGAYALKVQGVEVHDREELETQRRIQASNMKVALQHAREKALALLRETPKGAPTMIGRYTEMVSALREAIQRRVGRLFACIPPDARPSVQRWAIELTETLK